MAISFLASLSSMAYIGALRRPRRAAGWNVRVSLKLATRQHQARAGEGLPFCAHRRSKMGRANRTSAGPCRGHPARSRNLPLSRANVATGTTSVAMRIANPFITITHVIGSLRVTFMISAQHRAVSRVVM